MKRVFLVVLDAVGIGNAPDAAAFGDIGANTLKSAYKTGKLNIPMLEKMGIGNIEGIDYLKKAENPIASVGRMVEKSNGKDTTVGHWEIAGIYSDSPMPTYPNGFPDEVIEAFKEATGRGVLCNKPASGTEVIREYGELHRKTGDLIVYTSADSVFQIAAHEDTVPLPLLYEYCKKAREILSGKHAVGRVIARPFIGNNGNYTRTASRRDFSLKPPKKSMLNAISEAGLEVISVGKISDIFLGDGITESIPTHGNGEGMKKTEELLLRDFRGLAFINLVDFDMLYGHRQDAEGFAKALSDFDAWLSGFIEKLGSDDALIITADHGCDPSDEDTDHSRECVPLIIYEKNQTAKAIGTKNGFGTVARTVTKMLGIDFIPDVYEEI